MGKMQNPWLEPTQLQTQGLLYLETGHAQSACCIDAMNALFAAQINAARASMKFLASVKPNTDQPFALPQADYTGAAEVQSEFAKSVREASTHLIHQTTTLQRSLWDEQQRLLKKLISN